MTLTTIFMLEVSNEFYCRGFYCRGLNTLGGVSWFSKMIYYPLFYLILDQNITFSDLSNKAYCKNSSVFEFSFIIVFIFQEELI